MVHYGMTIFHKIARQYFQKQLEELKAQVPSQNLSRTNGTMSKMLHEQHNMDPYISGTKRLFWQVTLKT